jgi:threonylcarbamoyladenosine tRNA methylthiotransferase MtaB
VFRFSIVTFGCRVNQADSFDCEGDLVAAGGVQAPPEEADLVVVNTCSVTVAADQAARQAIRRIARRNPSARIVATGCYATRQPADLEQLPGVIRLVSNDDKRRLAAIALGGSVQAARGSFTPGDRGRTAFLLRVQTGCDESCSYCTIPATRGPSRSRPLDEVLDEARALVAGGYAELALTGVHLGAYGRDLRPPSSLIRLLEGLDALPGRFTVRISSLEPMDCPPDVVQLIAASDRFARHLHFPLQHASDALLGAMRRPYRLADYRALVDRTRAAMPDAAIGCDAIAGFPGETDGDHALLEEYLASSPVTHLHVFPYSERPGTVAASLPGKVPASVVSSRCRSLREIARQLGAAFARRQVGSVRPALTIDDGTRAVTDNYLKVCIPSGRRRNERVRVRILSAAPLRGEVVA